MTTPGSDRLDGNPGGNAWPWRPTILYRTITGLFQRATARTAGPAPGTNWPSTSTLDEVTCLAEDLSVELTGPDGKKYTLSDMVVFNFCKAKGWNISDDGTLTA